MNEVVQVGCRLPNGITLEINLQRTVKGGPQGRPIAQIKRMDGYQSRTLKGHHAHTLELRRTGIRLPSELNPRPFINNVPKDFWDKWMQENKGSALMANGDLFVIKDGHDQNNVNAAVLDASARKQPLAPADPTKPIKVGDATIEKANWDDK